MRALPSSMLTRIISDSQMLVVISHTRQLWFGACHVLCHPDDARTSICDLNDATLHVCLSRCWQMLTTLSHVLPQSTQSFNFLARLLVGLQDMNNFCSPEHSLTLAKRTRITLAVVSCSLCSPWLTVRPEEAGGLQPRLDARGGSGSFQRALNGWCSFPCSGTNVDPGLSRTPG